MGPSSPGSRPDPAPPPVVEAVLVNALAAKALATPFRVTSVSYEGTFGAPVERHLDLSLVAAAFGDQGTSHEINDRIHGTLNGARVDVDGLVDQQKSKPERKLVNFLVVKLRLLGLNVSIKLYTTRYFQLFGIADTPQLLAQDLCHLVLRFVQDLLNGYQQTGPWLDSLVDLRTMALSAKHAGVSEQGLVFNMEALQAAFAERHQSNPCLEMKINHRNGSLVVRTETKGGSQMFHGTGTMQLFGMRTAPETTLDELRALVAAHPDVLMVAAEAPVTGRKRRRQPATSEAKRPRATSSTVAQQPVAPLVVGRAAGEMEAILSGLMDDGEMALDFFATATDGPVGSDVSTVDGAECAATDRAAAALLDELLPMTDDWLSSLKTLDTHDGVSLPTLL
mmetsp:Transcript_29675/g.64099  ORF Transcript_29675/g.64099 Transcript_29675/m.64099 type:complete len:394 (-) Transcript_29675:105-1286(-)